MLLPTLLFFHVLAAIGLFAGIIVELLALIRIHRAVTVADVRAATLNVPVVGPMMGLSALVLIAMGITMVITGGFAWNAGWINVVFAVTIVLAILGPTVTGRRAEALHAAALAAADGPITPDIDVRRRDRFFNYMVFVSLLELVAALYIMVVKPETSTALAAAVAAAVIALLPVALLTRSNNARVAAEPSI
jgi:uncharacterized membrane protein